VEEAAEAKAVAETAGTEFTERDPELKASRPLSEEGENIEEEAEEKAVGNGEEEEEEEEGAE
jgi:hypothetical protein